MDNIECDKKSELNTLSGILQKAQEREAQGEATAVFDWKFPKVMDAAIPALHIARQVQKLHMLTQQAAQKHPRWSNDELRAYLRRKHSEFNDMADRTHPHLYLMVTDRNLSPQNMKRIQDLIVIRYMHENNNNVKENTDTISAYFNKEFYHIGQGTGASTQK